jgi:arsenite-transporting ATPase
MAALGNADETTIILVARPEAGALKEAARTAAELGQLGIRNQRLIVNGIFRAADRNDVTAVSLENVGQEALSNLPETLRSLPRADVPLRPFNMVGIGALRALLTGDPPSTFTGSAAARITASPLPPISRLIDRLASEKRGLILVMGKGGVGKTTIASAIALGLVERGHSVHLSTTDPAAHLSMTLAGRAAGLKVDRIDPKVETERYIAKIIESRQRDLDEQGLALLREDLQSPCTEEVAVFGAFSRIVSEARSSFVVLDTAPTGHSLLLMDATGAYHRQMTRDAQSIEAPGKIVTPMMRLRDPRYTRVLLVTLPETTPVLQADALQGDLRRAGIEPYAWIINRSLLATGTRDPLLLQRLEGERKEVSRVCSGMAKEVYFVPWQAAPPVGVAALRALTESNAA